jgi:hypothetical protein
MTDYGVEAQRLTQAAQSPPKPQVAASVPCCFNSASK